MYEVTGFTYTSLATPPTHSVALTTSSWTHIATQASWLEEGLWKVHVQSMSNRYFNGKITKGIIMRIWNNSKQCIAGLKMSAEYALFT